MQGHGQFKGVPLLIRRALPLLIPLICASCSVGPITVSVQPITPAAHGSGQVESLRNPLPQVRARMVAAHPDAEIAIAAAPVGQAPTPVIDGQSDESEMPSWSTIKVPLALAALKQKPDLMNAATRAITYSDNDSAMTLWNSLGSPQRAANAVEAQLRQAGDGSTDVPAQVTVPGRTAFGQTRWSTHNQALFAAALPCMDGSEPVLRLMGEVEPAQRWGLVEREGVALKGGWGQTARGYVVRQLVILDRKTALAVAVRVPGGDFDRAVAILIDVVAAAMAEQLPSGTCPNRMN